MRLSKNTFASTILIMWVVLFTAGILVDTAPYRNVITFGTWTNPSEAATSTFEPNLWDRVIAWPIILTLYAVPNLLILCMLSAMVGVAARNAQIQTDPGESSSKLTYFGAALIGFLLYLTFMAGLVTVTSAAEFIQPTQDTYIRRAPLLSIIGFMLTYEPKLLSLLVQRIGEFSESTIKPKRENYNNKEADGHNENAE